MAQQSDPITSPGQLAALQTRLLAAAPAEICLFDRNGRFLYASPPAIPDEVVRRWVVGRDHHDWFRARGHPESLAERRQQAIETVVKTGRPTVLEEVRPRPLGGERRFVLRYAPITTPEGRVRNVVGVALETPDSSEPGPVGADGNRAEPAEMERLRHDRAALRADLDRRVRFQERRQALQMGRTLASWSLDDPTTTTGGNTLSSVVVGAAALTATGAPVLLVAEPGIPTEAVARAIHHRGDRRSGPFVALDCSLMPAEVFEGKLFGGPEGEGSTAAAGALDLAERGTLFLEHLPVLGAAAQARLSAELAESPEGGGRKLRDVQLIGTTAHELGADADAVASPPQSRHRLNALPIHLPPLRHRPTDVERLARAVLTRAASRLGKTLRSLTQAEVERLLAYPWPGNESELQAVMERAATTARGERPQIRLPGDPVGDVENRRETESAGYFTESEMRARERANLVAVLQSTSWKVYGPDGAAARLGIRPTTLASRIKKLGLKEGG